MMLFPQGIGLNVRCPNGNSPINTRPCRRYGRRKDNNMSTNSTPRETLRIKKETIDILDTLFEQLDRERHYVLRAYVPTGEYETRNHWKTGEIILDDNGEPKQFPIEEERIRDASEITDEYSLAKLSAIEAVEAHLSRLV